jgi:hypothetical protein
MVEDVASFGGMLQLSVRLGNTQLFIVADRSSKQINGPCRLDIDPVNPGLEDFMITSR